MRFRFFIINLIFQVVAVKMIFFFWEASKNVKSKVAIIINIADDDIKVEYPWRGRYRNLLKGNREERRGEIDSVSTIANTICE